MSRGERLTFSGRTRLPYLMKSLLAAERFHLPRTGTPPIVFKGAADKSRAERQEKDEIQRHFAVMVCPVREEAGKKHGDSHPSHQQTRQLSIVIEKIPRIVIRMHPAASGMIKEALKPYVCVSYRKQNGYNR